MTQLVCNVSNCLHNSDKRCCKQTIIVDGHQAQDAQETCCESFDENREGFFRNVFKTPENHLEVDCAALKCAYNEDRHCAAEHIDITGDGADKAEYTECSTFKARL